MKNFEAFSIEGIEIQPNTEVKNEGMIMSNGEKVIYIHNTFWS